MSYTNTYYPDYEKMYPGVKITPEVLAALRASDRQMRRFESELKTERFEADNEKQVARFIPSREDSYERLVEEDRLQFADPAKFSSPCSRHWLNERVKPSPIGGDGVTNCK